MLIFMAFVLWNLVGDHPLHGYLPPSRHERFREGDLGDRDHPGPVPRRAGHLIVNHPGMAERNTAWTVIRARAQPAALDQPDRAPQPDHPRRARPAPPAADAAGPPDPQRPPLDASSGRALALGNKTSSARSPACERCQPLLADPARPSRPRACSRPPNRRKSATRQPAHTDRTAAPTTEANPSRPTQAPRTHLAGRARPPWLGVGGRVPTSDPEQRRPHSTVRSPRFGRSHAPCTSTLR
jgi:hypothetical protein